MRTSSGTRGSVSLGTGSPDRPHWVLCRLYMDTGLQGSPGRPSLSCYLGLVCGPVLQGMGFCGQPRTLKQSFSYVELLQAEVNLSVSSSCPVSPLLLISFSLLLFSSPSPPCSFTPSPSPSSSLWPSIYCVAQATLTFPILQLMSTRVIGVHLWRGNSTELCLGTQDESDLGPLLILGSPPHVQAYRHC
jgi:hypothetical protein